MLDQIGETPHSEPVSRSLFSQKRTWTLDKKNIAKGPYRVGSANFSRRKIGHAHENSTDSENVAGAREPSVHAHFISRFKNGQGNQSIFFLPMNKIQLK